RPILEVGAETLGEATEGGGGGEESRFKLSSEGTAERREEGAVADAGGGVGVSECRAAGRGGEAMAGGGSAPVPAVRATGFANVLGFAKSSSARRSLPPFPSDTRPQLLRRVIPRRISTASAQPTYTSTYNPF